MSSSNNTALGIALVCGAAACALTCAVTDLGLTIGAPVGVVAAGVSLIFQGQKPTEEKEEKEKESKKPKGKKPAKKSAPPPQVPSTPEPAEKKKPKKSKKVEKESAPKSSSPKSPPPVAKSPPPQQKAKAPQKTPSVDSEEKKEPTKTQLQKAKKKQKKEAEEKAKAEEKALELKREQAQAKKAAKAAQKKKEVVSPQVQAQVSDEEDVKEEEVLEDGWEKPKPRNTVRIRSPQDEKKRQASKSKGLPAPSSEGPKVVVEVIVPKNKHGSIIGPKGTFLALIQSSTGATVTMPKREGGGLGVVISGSAAQVKEAEQVVRDISNKGYSSLTHPDFQSNTFTVDDAKDIGRIAGKKGVYLKAIQEKSGASLQLPDKKSPGPGNVITIVGKQSEITNAKLALNELLSQGFCSYTHPGWITEEFDFNPEFLGRLIGPGGENISHLCDKYKVKIDTPKKDDPTQKQDIIVIKGPQQNIERAKEAIAELLVVNEVVEEIPAADPNDPWQQDPQEPEW